MSRQATKINITEEQRASLENGYRNGASHSFRMRCLMFFGKADGLSNAAAGARAGQTYQRVPHWVKRFFGTGNRWTEKQSRKWTQAYHQYQGGQGGCKGSNQTTSPERFQSKSRMGGSNWQADQGWSLPEFFILSGARFGRIRKTPKGTPSPQEYGYKKELLQELERQWAYGLIDLYYGDESHVCTEGYVPYAWKFKDEDFFIPVCKGGRLNIFGMIDRNCNYHGFTTQGSINSDKFIEFMENFSLGICKETVVVLDNSSIHKSRKVKDCLERWKERGLHIFYLPPYSPHLNIAETLWRILKVNGFSHTTTEINMACSPLLRPFSRTSGNNT